VAAEEAPAGVADVVAAIGVAVADTRLPPVAVAVADAVAAGPGVAEDEVEHRPAGPVAVVAPAAVAGHRRPGAEAAAAVAVVAAPAQPLVVPADVEVEVAVGHRRPGAEAAAAVAVVAAPALPPSAA